MCAQKQKKRGRLTIEEATLLWQVARVVSASKKVLPIDLNFYCLFANTTVLRVGMQLFFNFRRPKSDRVPDLIRELLAHRRLGTQSGSGSGAACDRHIYTTRQACDRHARRVFCPAVQGPIKSPSRSGNDVCYGRRGVSPARVCLLPIFLH